MASDKLILDCVNEHEAAQPDRIYLTQPIGGGQVIDCTWAQVLDQSRRMAAHLRSRVVRLVAPSVGKRELHSAHHITQQRHSDAHPQALLEGQAGQACPAR